MGLDLHLRCHKNDVDSNVWKPHIHHRFEHDTWAKFFLDEASHPTDCIGELRLSALISKNHLDLRIAS